MAEALKDRYNKSFILNVGENMKAAYVQFSIEHFDKDIFTAEWELYELKDRMYHISKVLKKHLPNDFKSACDILIDFVKNKLEHDQSGMNFEHMFLGDFVEKNGLSDFKTSFKTMEEITKFSSCEFAIRPFIIKDQNATFKQLSKWANSKHPMVRRLSTEGCRPLLPWAMKLPRLVVDPKPILD
ncbi:MAG: DNA alkylation repair protein, partial [Flavobacteriales bacterium]|nr:DNA alkylation repair protein [Flavobacteriales bacterium]